MEQNEFQAYEWMVKDPTTVVLPIRLRKILEVHERMGSTFSGSLEVASHVRTHAETPKLPSTATQNGTAYYNSKLGSIFQHILHGWFLILPVATPSGPMEQVAILKTT